MRAVTVTANSFSNGPQVEFYHGLEHHRRPRTRDVTWKQYNRLVRVVRDLAALGQVNIGPLTDGLGWEAWTV
jgi:hypothetical protein